MNNIYFVKHEDTASHRYQGFQPEASERGKRSRHEDPVDFAASILMEMAGDTCDGFSVQPMRQEGQPAQRHFTQYDDNDADIFTAEESDSGELTDPQHRDDQKKVKKSFTATPAHPFFHGKIKFFDESIQILFLTIIAEANTRVWHEAKQISDLLKAYAVFVSSPPKSKADREYSASDEQKFFEQLASILLKKDRCFASEFGFTQTKLERSPGSYNITASKIITLATSIEGKLIDPILRRGFDEETFSALIAAGQVNLFA